MIFHPDKQDSLSSVPQLSTYVPEMWSGVVEEVQNPKLPPLLFPVLREKVFHSVWLHIRFTDSAENENENISNLGGYPPSKSPCSLVTLYSYLHSLWSFFNTKKLFNNIFLDIWVCQISKCSPTMVDRSW